MHVMMRPLLPLRLMICVSLALSLHHLSCLVVRVQAQAQAGGVVATETDKLSTSTAAPKTTENEDTSSSSSSSATTISTPFTDASADLTRRGLMLLAEKDKEFEGYALLTEAAERGDAGARYTLALRLLRGNASDVAMDLNAAFKEMRSLAEETGHAGAQWTLGVMYAMGLGVEASQARALVYYTFAALGGHPQAQMALGFRYSTGLGVAHDCEMALHHYSQAAETVQKDVQLTGGVLVERERLASTQPRNPNALNKEDLVDYYQNSADSGSAQAQLVTGQLYYQGQGVAQDYGVAHRYFNAAAAQGNSQAMAYLGEMAASGLGREQDNVTALEQYKKAANLKDASGMTGLGKLYLHGQGVPRNNARAFELFEAAAGQGHGEGQLHLGEMYYSGLGTKRDYRRAMHYFTLAAQHGHVLAMYNLAQMHATGVGAVRNCQMATGLFKNVAERGRWALQLGEAAQDHAAGNDDAAAVTYLLMAESGYEVAQHNAAHVLEEGGLGPLKAGSEGAYRRALLNWRRSAAQGEYSARVKIGDYLYYGHGTPADAQAAAGEYRRAADASNPQAMFNLAYMHEHGLGLPQDLHLAKRYYDMSAQTNAESQLPAGLALFLLHAKFLYHDFAEAIGWTEGLLSDEDAEEGMTARSTAEGAGRGDEGDWASDVITGLGLSSLLEGNIDIDNLIAGRENTLIAVLTVVLVVVLLARQLNTHMAQERHRRLMAAYQRRVAEAENAARAEAEAAAAAAAAADAAVAAQEPDSAVLIQPHE